MSCRLFMSHTLSPARVSLKWSINFRFSPLNLSYENESRGFAMARMNQHQQRRENGNLSSHHTIRQSFDRVVHIFLFVL